MNTLLQTAAVLALLDSVAPVDPKARLDAVNPDLVAGDASAYALQTISLKAAAAVQELVETPADDLTDGEGFADRLLALLVGVADENKDGELSEEEQTIVSVAMNESWSYMAAKGVAESDLDTLFNSDDPAEANSAGARIVEFLADNMPDGEEASLDELDDFAFGGDAQAGVFDAVYKKRFAVRGGKKMRVRKRISGTVRLSGKQKVAVRKMHLKSHGAKATMKRMKSMRVRKSMGM